MKDFDKDHRHRIEPLPTETIEIVISAIVRKRDNYQEEIGKILAYVQRQFPELKLEGMNSPVQVRIKIK